MLPRKGIMKLEGEQTQKTIMGKVVVTVKGEKNPAKVTVKIITK